LFHLFPFPFQTAYYSFYLPIACGLILAGAPPSALEATKGIALEMGRYFQVRGERERERASFFFLTRAGGLVPSLSALHLSLCLSPLSLSLSLSPSR